MSKKYASCFERRVSSETKQKRGRDVKRRQGQTKTDRNMRRILQKFLVVVAAAMWIGTAVAQTSGVEGGVKWSVSNGVLTISAASATECEEGYQPGYMKDYINPSSGSCGAVNGGDESCS